MAVIQQLLNLILCRINQIGIFHLNRYRADIFLAEQPQISGRKRDDYHVVLIGAAKACAFGFKSSDHLKGYFLDQNILADGV
ncbi:hypothetical protein FQZ97_1052270 [compost metagenome]